MLGGRAPLYPERLDFERLVFNSFAQMKPPRALYRPQCSPCCRASGSSGKHSPCSSQHGISWVISALGSQLASMRGIMTETSFMRLSSEQELVHNRFRFQKWPPSGPKNSKSLYLTPCLRTSAAGKHGACGYRGRRGSGNGGGSDSLLLSSVCVRGDSLLLPSA